MLNLLNRLYMCVHMYVYMCKNNNYKSHKLQRDKGKNDTSMEFKNKT